MEYANTWAAKAYANLTSGIDWVNLTNAQEIVVLEEIRKALSGRSPNEAVFDFGLSPQTGQRVVRTVGETLDTVERRIQIRKFTLLASVGGRVADLRRELLKAERDMPLSYQNLQAA
jgi:hypothetical protein